MGVAIKNCPVKLSGAFIWAWLLEVICVFFMHAFYRKIN